MTSEQEPGSAGTAGGGVIERHPQRLGEWLRASNQSVWEADLVGRAMLLAPRWYELLGLPVRTEPLPWDEYQRQVHPEDRRSMEAVAEMLLKNPDPDGYGREIRFVTADGDTRWLVSRGAIVAFDAAGRPLRGMGVHQDVTERKRLEFALQQARQAAEAATQAKADLLAYLSHEIRAPTSAIIGMSEAALAESDDDGRRRLLENLNRASQRLLATLNDALDQSKLQAGRMTLEQTPFPLDEVVEQSIVLAREAAPGSDLRLRLERDAAIPDLLIGDPLRLGQVLSNLLGNAVKFTPRGEVRLSVEPAAAPPGRIGVRFAVADTGIGLSADELQRLFSPYAQASAATSRRYGGTGLGLAISRQLVELMGGALEVDSAPGRGTCFRFTLQFARAAAPPRTPEHVAAGRSVLVVCDRDAIRQEWMRDVAGLGARVEGARDGGEAVAGVWRGWARGSAPDVALIDAEMLAPSGVECAQRIQRELGDGAPAIVLVSSHLHSEIRPVLAALDVAVAALLPKPWTRAELADALAGALAGPPAARAAGAVAPDVRFTDAHVLVVDDDPLTRETMAIQLRKLGARATTVADGDEALAALAHGPLFDAVLLDCLMPERDGYAVARALRRRPAHMALPVIALTGMAGHAERVRALEAGMDDFVTKPVDLRTLGAVLARWVLPASAVTPDAAGGNGTAPAPLLDVAVARFVTGGDEAAARLMLTRYLELLPSCVDALTAAADVDTLLHAAHRLRGASASVGARRVQDAAAAVEDAARRGADPSTLVAGVQRVVDAAQGTAASVRAFLDQTDRA